VKSWVRSHGSSAGISLTHQAQILRSEVKSGVYKIAPATPLSRGEYALYLSRGEGMAPYVYDFGAQESQPVVAKEEAKVPARDMPESRPIADASTKQSSPTASHQTFGQASVSVFCEGNPNVRHDGVMLTALSPGGPADQAGIKAGDVILAINDHYMFTITELKKEISHHQPGTKISVRYRRYSTIYGASLVVGTVE
jgi:membrane-associated protease RseP (regulator of RpoE activity)